MVMKNQIAIFYALIFALAASFPVAAATIDLRTSDTLLPFFQAGIYPRNFRGLENYDCEVLNQHLHFILPDGKEVQIEAKVTRIGVYENDKLSYIQAYTDYISLDEAFKQSAAVHELIGKSTDDLRTYLDKVRANWIYPKAQYGVMTKTNPRLAAFFLKGAFEDRPLRFAIKIEWFRPPKEEKARTIAITPPPGYEHISMEPAPHPGIKRTEADQNNEPTPQKISREKVAVARQKQQSPEENIVAETKPYLWWLWGIGTAVMALLLLLVSKLRSQR